MQLRGCGLTKRADGLWRHADEKQVVAFEETCMHEKRPPNQKHDRESTLRANNLLNGDTNRVCVSGA